MAKHDPYLIDSHKMHYHPQRVAQWMRAKTIEEKLAVYPIYVEISPVGHCNHRCTFCAVDYIGYKVRKLDTDVLCRSLLDMSELGVKSVMFAGEGEPMLHPDIVLITNYAKSVGLDVSFTTNGTALTKKFADSALDAVKWIKVSMNGGSESYGLVHGTKQGDYERVWSNLHYAVTRRKVTAIGVQCVVLPDNLKCIKGIIRRAIDTGLDYIVLKPYSQHKSSVTQTYKEVKYTQKEIADTIHEAENMGTETFKVITRSQAMEDWDAGIHMYSRCSATPYFWAYIMATGDVYSCSAYLMDDRFNLGNVNSSSFKEIWQGEKRRANIEYVENQLDIHECRVNCRMNQVNKALWDVSHPNEHSNFI